MTQTDNDDKFMQEVAAIKQERAQARHIADMERGYNQYIQSYYEDKMQQISREHDAVLRKMILNSTY